MTTEQAYIEGFVKRASEYGFSETEAEVLLKKATRWRDEMLAGNIGVFHPTEMGKNVFRGDELAEPIHSNLHSMTGEMGWEPSKGVRAHPDFQKEKQISQHYNSLAKSEGDIYASIRKNRATNSPASNIIVEDQLARLKRIDDTMHNQRENLRELRGKGNIGIGSSYEKDLRAVRKNLSETPERWTARGAEMASKINEQALRRSAVAKAETTLPNRTLSKLKALFSKA